jgi:hypothetical protein
MRSTGICTTPRSRRTARGYAHPTRGPATPQPHAIHHPSVSFSAGALCATAGDLLVWQDALAAGRVVSPASYALMTTPPVLASGKPGPYGLGMFVEDRGGERRIYHGGAASGSITQVGFYPKDRLGVVVLTNGVYAGSIVEQIEAAVARAARGLPMRMTERRPISAAERARFAGVYQVGPIKVDVFEQGEDLRAMPTGQVATRLLHQGGRVFLAEHDPNLRVEFSLEGSKAASLMLSQGGRALPLGSRISDENVSSR